MAGNAAGSVLIPGAANGFLYLPGGSGNYASTPNAAPVQITGDITVDLRIAPATWNPTSTQTQLAKYIASNHSYALNLTTGGGFTMLASANGTTDVSLASSTSTGFSAGTIHWLRVSLQLNSAGSSLCKFYTAAGTLTNPISTDWAQLGTNITGTSLASIFNGTAVFEMGSALAGTANNCVSSFYEVKLYSSALGTASGTPVFDANFATKTFGSNTFTESSANAATVTVNGTKAQLGDGRSSFRGLGVVQAVPRLAVM